MAPIAVDPSTSTKTKKTRRGGAAAKRHLKAARIAPEENINASQNAEDEDEDDQVMIDPSNSTVANIVMTQIIDNDQNDEMMDTENISNDNPTPNFAPLPASAQTTSAKGEIRRIPIPPHRLTPLKKDWINIYSPLTEILGLQVRMNVQKRAVEVRTSKHTKEVGAIQKGADFVKAYALGFDVQDSIALLRMDDLYLDSFEIKDVKTLHGDHLSRAIGRIAGQDGKTKFTIENASRTRIILADTKIHILGSFQNIKIARDAIVSLIMGSPPGKVYASLRTIGARMRQRAL